MSRGRVGTSGRATRKPVVVVAGEDANDRRSLQIVMEALCPGVRGRMVHISDSVRLRGATGGVLKDRVSTLHRKAQARAAKERAALACMFVHEDWDAVDDDQRVTAAWRVQAELDAQVGASHYVLASWEIEAWLLLFPSAFPVVSERWSVPKKYRGSDTGKLANPKEILKNECSRGRRYREDDAPSLLTAAAERDFPRDPTGSNRSWDAFRAHVAACCEQHLP